MSDGPIDLEEFCCSTRERLAEIDREISGLRSQHAGLTRKVKAAELLLGYTSPAALQAEQTTLSAQILLLMADGRQRNAKAIRIELSGKVEPAKLSTYSSNFYNTLARLVRRGRLAYGMGVYQTLAKP